MLQWAISDIYGHLRYGAWRTRKEAIAEHVWAMDQVCYDKGRPPSWKPLDADQRKAWQKCRKWGHRAVRVNVTHAHREGE